MFDYPYAFRLSSIEPNSRTISQKFSLPKVHRWNYDVGHNPHPRRVKHFFGLQNIPICHVFDAPITKKQQTLSTEIEGDNFLNPVNTLTGIAISRTKRKSNLNEEVSTGNIPFLDTWRRELRALTESIIFQIPEGKGLSQSQPYNLMYNQCDPMSRQTISPLLSISRPKTHRDFINERERLTTSISKLTTARFQKYRSGDNQTSEYESQIFSLLCQILQTFDETFIKNWLATANDKEKGVVMNLIKTAFESKLKEDMTNNEKENVKTKFDDYYSNETLVRTKDHDRLILSPDCNSKPLTSASQIRITPSGCRPRTSLSLSRDKDNENESKSNSSSVAIRYKKSAKMKPERSEEYFSFN